MVCVNRGLVWKLEDPSSAVMTVYVVTPVPVMHCSLVAFALVSHNYQTMGTFLVSTITIAT